MKPAIAVGNNEMSEIASGPVAGVILIGLGETAGALLVIQNCELSWAVWLSLVVTLT